MPKALVLVQGINSKPYLKEALTEGGFDFTPYEEVTQAATEKVFDQHALSKLGFWDWVGDIWQFYRNTTRRKKACRAVRKKIFDLQEQGYEVDLVAHSLGCQIALCSGPQKSDEQVNISRCLFLASPMGIILTPLAWIVRRHARKYKKNFKSGSVDYLWSNNDPISRSFKKWTKRVFDGVTENLIDTNTGSEHSVQNYIRSYYEIEAKSVSAIIV